MTCSRNTHVLMLAISLLLGSLPVAAVAHPFSLRGAGHVTQWAGLCANNHFIRCPGSFSINPRSASSPHGLQPIISMMIRWDVPWMCSMRLG